MNRKWMLFTAVILLITLPLAACGGSGDSSETNGVVDQTEGSQEVTEVIESTDAPLGNADNSGGVTKGKLDTIVDYTDAWTELYATHEAVVNAYQGMPVLELVMVGLPLANSIFYSMLNLENNDGDFSGKVGFSDVSGFYNKKGDVATFGNDYLREADGFTANEKAGDQVITNGYFDAGKGYLKVEDLSKREGNIISRSYTEYYHLKDGGFVSLYQVSGDYDYGGAEAKNNSLTFIDMNLEHYEYVVAEGTAGVSGTLIELKDDMTVSEAEALFIEAGYTIKVKGGIRDGVFVAE